MFTVLIVTGPASFGYTFLAHSCARLLTPPNGFPGSEKATGRSAGIVGEPGRGLERVPEQAGSNRAGPAKGVQTQRFKSFNQAGLPAGLFQTGQQLADAPGHLRRGRQRRAGFQHRPVPLEFPGEHLGARPEQRGSPNRAG